MANKGYIKLARAIEDSEIWSKPPYYIKAWVHILNKAAFKPYGNLKTGECIISSEELQEVCSYKAGRRIEKPSAKQIRDFISFLRSDESNDGGNNESPPNDAMIVTMKVKGGLLVKVLNYERYQTSEAYESNNESSDGSHTEVTMEVVRKSDEGTNQIKEAFKALESLKALEENHLIKERTPYDYVSPFADVEDELRQKEEEQRNLYDQNLFELFESEFNRPVSPREFELLGCWSKDYDDTLIRYALREALTYNKKSFDYIERILMDWKQKGFTAEQYEKGER